MFASALQPRSMPGSHGHEKLVQTTVLRIARPRRHFVPAHWFEPLDHVRLQALRAIVDGGTPMVATPLIEAIARAVRDMPFHEREAYAVTEAALTAITEQGMVIAPRDPTPAMLDAFVARALNVSVHGDGGWSNYGREQWRAMISAAQGDG